MIIKAILAKNKILLSGLLARLVAVGVVDHEEVVADVAVPCEHVNM